MSSSSYIELRLAGEADQVLHADDDHTVVEIAVTVARDMALHGHLSESAQIIAPIWNCAVSNPEDELSFSLDFVRDTISRAGLELIWRGARFAPTNIDEWLPRFEKLEYTDETVEMEQREYFCTPDMHGDVNASPPLDKSIVSRWETIQGMLAVQIDADTNARSLPGPEVELQALELLQAYIDQLPSSVVEGWYNSRPTALALDLALKCNDLDLAQKVLKIIGTRIANLAASATRDAALAPRVGQIVSTTTILQEATGLTSARAQEITSELVKSLDVRLSSGEPRPYAELSWTRLMIEIEAREVETRDDEHAALFPFLCPPASPAQIALVEEELGITLPQDYKDFLAFTNGLGSYNTSQVTPLLRVDQIFWDVDHRNLKVEYRRFEPSNPKIARLPPLQRVLQVSEIDENAAANWWLIEPVLVRDAKQCMEESGAADWLGVNYAEWNPVFSNRGSFRIMMERRLSFLAKDRPVQP